MDPIKTLGLAMCIALLAGCSSPQDKAAKAQEGAYTAQENVAKQRLELTDKYQKCVKDAGGDQQKAAACDSYLKAAEALK
jgi:uncharacterized lipoprotein YajG